MFADTHGSQYPSNSWQIAGSVSLSDLDWEIVSSGNLPTANISRTILLREKEPRFSPRGDFVRAYAFADGHTELLYSPAKDFAAVEKQRGFLAQPVGN